MDNEMNKNYLSWEEAFLALCKLVSLRSKDLTNRSGSCIVDSKNRIMSLGYTGLPLGCKDELFPHGNSDCLYDSASAYMIPSIINAIIIARRNLDGCTLYTTDFPCSESTKMIIQNGITKICYINDEYLDEDDYRASKRMLKASGIIYQKMNDINVECANKDLITWDEAFVGVSKLVAMRSKDPNTQVGSCIVDEKNRIISLGYNGLPFGCNDNEFPWARSAKYPSDTKYPYVVHAEPNAINIAHSTSPKDLSNARMYVTLFPCHSCAAKIIQAGLKEILYVSDKYANTDGTKAAKRMLDESGVKYHSIPDVDVTVKCYKKIIKR